MVGIKHKYLVDVRYDKGLKLPGGLHIHNYYELLSSLKKMSDAEFEKLASKDRVAIKKWVVDNYNDFRLVKKLKNKNTRNKYISVLESHIRELEKESVLINGLVERRRELQHRKSQIFPYVWFAVYIVLILALFFQHSYYSGTLNEMQSDLSAKRLSLSDLLERNSWLEREILDVGSEKEALSSLSEELLERNRALASQIEKIYSNISGGPADRIPERDILVEPGMVRILVGNASLSRFTDTRSMLPVLNTGANAIQVVPGSYSDVFIGDIISYESSDGDIIIHRVIETGFDDDGWYAVMKGDSSISPDPEKVRFGQVRRVLVAIVY